MHPASNSLLGVVRGILPGVRFQEWLGPRAAWLGQLRQRAAEYVQGVRAFTLDFMVWFSETGP